MISNTEEKEVELWGGKVIKYIQELLQTDVGQLHWYKAVKSNFEVVM